MSLYIRPFVAPEPAFEDLMDFDIFDIFSPLTPGFRAYPLAREPGMGCAFSRQNSLRRPGLEPSKDFAVCIDAKEYKPEEINVEVDKENRVVKVKASHEENDERGGYFSKRCFERTYTLPENCNVDEVTKDFRQDGKLVIKAPKATPAVTNEGNKASLNADKGFTVDIDVAQFDTKTLDLEVNPDTRVAIVSAMNKTENGPKLSKIFAIPREFDLDKIACKVGKNNVLTVSVPRLEPKKLNILIEMEVE